MDNAKRSGSFLIALGASVFFFGLLPNDAYPERVDNRPIVWFAPDSESPDLLDIFRYPARWESARAHVNVFKLSAQQLSPGKPHQVNNFQNLKDAHIFEALASWHISLAAETGAVKEWDCTGRLAALQTIGMLRNIAAAAGKVDYIAMDEPLLSGTGPCKLSVAETAARTTLYARLVQEGRSNKGETPLLHLGDIEPYPSFSVQDLKDWINALQLQGIKLDFLHLDINVAYVDSHREIRMEQDLVDLSSFMRSANIPFGIIFWSGHDPVNSDKLYYDYTMRFLSRVHRAIKAPDQVVFQSWVTRSSGKCPMSTPTCAKLRCSESDPPYCSKKSIPLNLPDTGAATFSHTKLIRDGLAALESPN